MDECIKATIYICLEQTPLTLNLVKFSTAEDVCIELCKQLGIGPVARHLFALRLHEKEKDKTCQIWFSPNCDLRESVNTKHLYDFRIRFKVPTVDRLRKIDIKSFNYYFHQVRHDLLSNNISDLCYDKHKCELMGFGVSDMFRVMLEQGVDRQIIESDYKKYIPREVVKHHYFFIKKPIHESLGALIRDGNRDVWYVKGEYLRQFEIMAPNYLSEHYHGLSDEAGEIRPVELNVNPFHKETPGIMISYEGTKQWSLLCAIDDLCYITVRNDDGTLEISRKNGIPSYLKFNSLSIMYSFVSLLDGYYRLMIKWTFNLSKDVWLPSLKKLYSMRCHGPVSGEFSYAKLDEKQNNKPGSFILRESETKYNIYFLDVCVNQSSKPKTYKITYENNEYRLENKKKFKSLAHLVSTYRRKNETAVAKETTEDKGNSLVLGDCLPPSEFDKSPLLICRIEEVGAIGSLDENNELLNQPARIIDPRNLQVYKNQKNVGKGNMTLVYRSILKQDKGKKTEVAMKMLKNEVRDKHMQYFLSLANKWSFLHSNAIVRLLGVTLSSPFSLVLEYLRLGPLDVYLNANHQILKLVDLVEAGAYLATALWHLEERGLVHGNIRCRKLLVCSHDESTFLVKLSDPGFHTYTIEDAHWMPPECYSNFNYAKMSNSADVWAFGTTLWQIFSLGKSPPKFENIEQVKKYYRSQKLPVPDGCPVDIYQLLVGCWELDSYRRKKPQEIMRDINQILYQVFNSRRTNSYSTPFTISDSSGSVISRQTGNLAPASETNNETENTYVGSSKSGQLISLADESLTQVPVSQLFSSSNAVGGINCKIGDLSMDGKLDDVWLLDNTTLHDDDYTPDMSALLAGFNLSSRPTNTNSCTSLQSILELDDSCNVVLQGRIGQGFYGEVYRGTLEKDKDSEPELVAVKKLKRNAIETCLYDFEREISIMKNLRHPNIVKIKGVIQEPEVSLVMEYVSHGSLQCYLKIYKDSLQENQLLKFALDVAKGMEYLGQKNIVHRDLAARNILVANDHLVKISDFGLAQFMEQNNYYMLKTSRELPIKWYAPESLRDGKFSVPTDVWSYGVTLWEMFSQGEDPVLPSSRGKDNDGDVDGHAGQQRLLNDLVAGKRLPCPGNCSQQVYTNLISPCWLADPHRRPSFAQLAAIIRDMADFQSFNLSPYEL